MNWTAIKNVLCTTKKFTDDVETYVPIQLSTQFQTFANTAYVQVRLAGDPRATTATADGVFDSFYLAEDSIYPPVNYYAGNAENTSNGSLIKSDRTNRKEYTLSALSDEEIKAVAPEMYPFTGWKCLENGKTYQNGDSLTLPNVDGENGSVTMVAQWILQSYGMDGMLGDVNQDGKVSVKDAMLLCERIRKGN